MTYAIPDGESPLESEKKGAAESIDQLMIQKQCFRWL